MISGSPETPPSDPNDDLFGLRETAPGTPEVNRVFLDVFLDAEGIMRARAVQDPAIKKSFLRNEQTVLPTVTFDENHQYRLEHRRDGETVAYTFRRLGRGYERSGFIVSRPLDDTDGYVVTLLPLNFEQHGKDMDEQLSAEARRYLQQYATELGVDPDQLHELAQLELIEEGHLTPVMKLLGRGVKNVALWPVTSPEKRRADIQAAAMLVLHALLFWPPFCLHPAIPILSMSGP
jgi:hypothetical protein